uniref:Flagellar protein FliL n=1 Tax=Desulfobacca acetoxidans TaxID=60893 RepID=A0A7V4LCC1_9BACT
MGKGKDAEEPTGAAKPQKRGFLKILLLAIAGLILAGGGFTAYVWLSEDEPPPAKAKEPKTPAPPAKDLVTMPLEPFLVNLADKETRRYLKLKVELEVNGEKSVKELEKYMPRIRDSLILLLSNKSYLDLASPEGKQQLKKEILTRITALPGGHKVTDVFFTDFVAQ